MADDDYKSWKTPVSRWQKLKPLARDKRHEPTGAEERLWAQLRNCQFDGVKFRRQHTIGQFIVDFYAAEHNLVIELDGPIHRAQQAKDAERRAYLEQRGLRVLRFVNDDVMTQLDLVLECIRSALVSDD